MMAFLSRHRGKLMALGGLSFGVVSKILLRHYGSNADMHDLVDYGRDGLILLGFTLPVSLMGKAKDEESPKLIAPGEISHQQPPGTP